MVGTVRFEARIRELVETIPDLVMLVDPLLVVRRTLREQIIILHRRLLAIVRDDEAGRRLITTLALENAKEYTRNWSLAESIVKIDRALAIAARARIRRRVSSDAASAHRVARCARPLCKRPRWWPGTAAT